MKKLLFIIIFIFVFSLALPTFSFAQGMPAPSSSTLLGINTAERIGNSGSSPDNSAIQIQQQEEQMGKQFLENLNNKTVTCLELKDADFEKIGEYFMSQSTGDTSRHIAMNEMMKRMMGDKGEEQMHTAWGKRGGGCGNSATFSSQGVGFIPMMQMMMGGGGNFMMGYDGWNNMTSGWNGFGFLGWLPMLLFWTLLILGVVALARYLGGFGRDNDKEKSHLDILRDRYAKGEIDKKEFEQMKKDLM